MKKTKTKKISKSKTKTKQSSAKRLRNSFLKVAIMIGLLLLSIHAFFDFFEREIFDTIVNHFEKRLAGLYIINYDSIDLDFFGGSIHVKNLSVQLDKKKMAKINTTVPLTKTLVETTLPDMKIDGISFLHLIFNQSLRMSKFSLEKLKLAIYKITAAGQSVPIFQVPECSIQFSQLTIYPYISFETGESKLKEPVFFFSSGFYSLKARTVNFFKSPVSSFLSLDFFELLPGHDKYKFARVKGYQTDRFQLKIDNITTRAIDFNDLFKKQRFYSKILTIKNPQLEVFRDKNMLKRINRPPKKFPQQLLRELEFKLRVDHIRVSNGYIDFIEHAKNEKKAGKIFFNEIQLKLTNLTNYPELLDGNISIELSASAKIMDRSMVNGNMKIPLNHKNNRFTLAGFLEKMDMRVFNSILEPNSHIRIRSGIIDKVNVSASYDNNLAKGEMRLFYRNLKISLLKTREGGTYKKMGFKSFMANIFLRQNNPKRGKPLKIGYILFRREQPISFFAFIWKGILSGFKSSVGI